MKDSKILLILRTFSKQEFKEFEKYVHSPFLNSAGEYIYSFLHCIKKYHPDFEHPDFTKQNIFIQLYPKEKYNDSRMRKLISETMKLSLDYLAAKNFMEDEQQKGRLILKELQDRNLSSLFEIKSKELTKKLDGNKIKDSQFYYEKYKLLLETKAFYFTRERKKSIRLFNEEMDNLTKYLVLLFIHKYIERFKEKRSFTETDFSLPLLKEITNYAEQNFAGKGNVFDLYYTELLLYISGEEKYYFSLKHLKEKLFNKIDKSSLSTIYTTLSNYATEQLENGKTSYLNEIFQLHKEILKRKLYGSIFSEFVYFNIVNIGLRLGETKFVEKFFDEYKSKLRKDIREDAYNYCLASINFSKKKYAEALENLSKVNFTLSLHRYLVRNLTIKIYYDLNETNSLYSLIDSYKHTLKRDNTVPENIRSFVTNFINLTRDLLRIKNGEKKKENIEARVEKEITAEKQWLLSKVKEFK